MRNHLQLLSTWSIILFFFPVFIIGCAGIGKKTMNPRVTLADIQINEIKSLETAFRIQLRVLNPNDIPLEIEGIESDLKIDGRNFATGVNGDHHVIPAYGSVIVPITVYASVLDMVSSVVALVQGTTPKNGEMQPLRYELSGHVRMGGSNIMKKTVPFETKGELNFGAMN